MTTAKTKTGGLFAKLLVAQTEAQAVEKRGENKAQHYSYAMASDVIAEAQRALHKAGLVGFVSPVEVEDREIQSAGGTGGLFVTLTAKLIIVDPESDEEPLEISGQGTGVDYPGDKAVYKALTGAAKYLYAGALGIPFGDDPEAESGNAGRDRAPSREPTRDTNRPASAPQKRNLTRIFNKAGVTKERQAAIVHALAGDPPTMSGVSGLLDRLFPVQDEPAELAEVIAFLHKKAGVDPAMGADDLPVDVDDEDTAPTEDELQLGIQTSDDAPFPTDEERGE